MREPLDDASADPRPDPVATEPAWRAKVRGSLVGNLVVLLVTALAVGLGYWYVTKNDGGAVSEVEVAGVGAAPRVGDAAPVFTAATVDGDEVALDDLRGRGVWVFFVATWCSGCRAEMPDVQAAHEAGANGAEIVAVYVGENTATVAPYVERLGLTFDQVPDARTDIAAAYGVRGVPAHYFIDADGIIRHTWVGVMSPTQITEALAKIA